MTKTIVNHKVAEFLKSIGADNKFDYEYCPLTELQGHISSASTEFLLDDDERAVLTALANEDGWEEEKPQQFQAYMKLPGKLTPDGFTYLVALHSRDGDAVSYIYSDFEKDFYEVERSFFTKDELDKYGLTDSVLTIRSVLNKEED
jgi:hypothetical protein